MDTPFKTKTDYCKELVKMEPKAKTFGTVQDRWLRHSPENPSLSNDSIRHILKSLENQILYFKGQKVFELSQGDFIEEGFKASSVSGLLYMRHEEHNLQANPNTHNKTWTISSSSENVGGEIETPADLATIMKTIKRQPNE